MPDINMHEAKTQFPKSIEIQADRSRWRATRKVPSPKPANPPSGGCRGKQEAGQEILHAERKYAGCRRFRRAFARYFQAAFEDG